jgi:Trypsin-like peptidase domain
MQPVIRRGCSVRITNPSRVKSLFLLMFCACCKGAVAGDSSVGTGLFYNALGHLFTNRHVVAECLPGTIRVRTQDQVWHPARVLAVDLRVDIAALSIDYEVPAFAAFRLFPGTKSISIPLEIEDAFSAGFSSPEENKFKLQYKWGQIQPWKNPNKFPYVNRMRMVTCSP